MKNKKLTLHAFLLCVLLPWLTNCQTGNTGTVAIESQGNYYILNNGYLGITVPKASLFDPSEPYRVPAPIRNVVYSDSGPSNDFPNFLQSTTPAISMAVEVLYQTTDSAALKVSYGFDKPVLYGGGGVIVDPGGPGYYRVTLTMFKGEKACVVTEESNFEVGYRVKVSDGLFPTKARWIGHHASSLENGYDPNGNVYVKNELVGWHATVDLNFKKQKDFDFLAKWGPFAQNTGWHWQFYNDNNVFYTNTLGIFDGKPSLLRGVPNSGAGLFVQPSALTDLTSTTDADGNVHLAWMSENQLAYKKINADGTSSPEVGLANSLDHPFVFTNGSTVNIFTNKADVGSTSQVWLARKMGSGDFNILVFTVDATVTDPFFYGASNGTFDFLLFEGTRNGQSGLLLYAAPANTTNYTFRDILPFGSASRSADRPDLKALPNGDILVAYTANPYQSFNLIPNGSDQFQSDDFQPFGQQITFGMAVDQRSGDLVWLKNDGSIQYSELSNGTVSATYASAPVAVVNHEAFTLPNRRSVTTDNAGNALFWHEGMFFYFDFASKNWSQLTGATWDAISPAQVSYNPQLAIFQILGKKDGILARFNFDGSGDPELAESYPTTERQTSGIRVQYKRIAPTGEFYPDIRFQWGIFVGNKNEDLPSADQVQPIAQTMNRLSGLAQKVDAYENNPLLLNPSFKNGGIYVPTADLQETIQKVKSDNEFYQQLALIDPYFKDVIDAWRDATGAKTNAVFQSIIDQKNALKQALKAGDGIFTFEYMYSAGANTMRRLCDQIAGLLADTQLSAAQRAELEKTAALFARIMWDDDFVPLFPEHGLTFGTANTVQTYTGQRWFFALNASSSAEFQARAAQVPAKWQEILSAQVNESGAAIGTPHYLQPTMDVVALTALQLKNAGIKDVFVASDTLRRFSDFLLHLLTPPSVRFLGQRKLVSIGDGGEESAAIFGLLATGYAGVDDDLSKKLIHAYKQGPPRGSDFGFVTLAVSHNLNEIDTFVAASGNFPGYMSMFRTLAGTPHESATWFVNGEWYQDHRNDDRGGLSIYALGVPLSLSFGSFYSPHLPGAHMKNAVVPVSQFPEWNQPNQPFVLPNNLTWATSQQTGYLAFANSGRARSRFTAGGQSWQRSVFQFQPESKMPIFIVQDTLAGSTGANIWNFNFMAEGDVATPQGIQTPPERTWNYNGGPNQPPTAGPAFSLSSAGFQRLDFQGQNWPQHPAGGIDWELYLEAPGTNQANLASWGHTFAPAIEQAEFFETNGSSYEERQTTVRVSGGDAFLAVIVPWYKGQRPEGMQVERKGDTVRVRADSFLFDTNLRYAFFEKKGKTVLTTFTTLPVDLDSLAISGGPAEVEVLDSLAFVRLHGETGIREIKLPATGDWQLLAPSPLAIFDAANQTWLLNRNETDSLHNSYTGGYTEFAFVDKNLVGAAKPSKKGGRESLKIFPNPTSGLVYVALNSPKAGKGKMALVNGNGAVVKQFAFDAVSGENLLQFQLGNLPDGVYAAKIEVGSSAWSGVIRYLR